MSVKCTCWRTFKHGRAIIAIIWHLRMFANGIKDQFEALLPSGGFPTVTGFQLLLGLISASFLFPGRKLAFLVFIFFNILSLVSLILQTYVHLWIVLIFPENILIFLNMPESEY